MQIISKIYFDGDGKIIRKELIPIRQANSEVNILQTFFSLEEGKDLTARLFCRLQNRQTYSFPRGADAIVHFDANEKQYYAEFIIDESATQLYGELDCTISLRQSVEDNSLEEPEIKVKVNNYRMFSWTVEETSMTDHTLTPEEQDDILDLQNDIAMLKEEVESKSEIIDAIPSIALDTMSIKNNYIGKGEKGVTIATLEGGKIPSEQLPSYVDDVLEIKGTIDVIPLLESEAELPNNIIDFNDLFETNEGAGGGDYYAIVGVFDRYAPFGSGNLKVYKIFYYRYLKSGITITNWTRMFEIVTGKIYVDTKSNISYRALMDEVIDPQSSIVLRSLFLIKISNFLELGETDKNAYYGDKGKENRIRIEALEEGVLEHNIKAEAQFDELKIEVNQLKSILYETVIDEVSFNYNYLDSELIPSAINTYPIVESAGCEIVKIAGNSRVFNQLQALNPNSLSKESNGIQMIDNRDGSYTFNGTAIAKTLIGFPSRGPLELNHKYLIRGCPSGGGSDTYSIRDGWNSSAPADYGEGVIYDYQREFDGFQLYIEFQEGITITDLKVVPQVFDLTRMFGAKYEPSTAAEFFKMFSDEYYEYNPGDIISSSVSKIVSYGKGGELLTSLNFPNQIKNESILSTPLYENSYEFEEQEDGTYNIIKQTKVASVDLGTLTWSTFGNGAWKATLPIRPLYEITAYAIAVPWLSTRYTFVPASKLESANPPDMSICENGSRLGLMIYDSNYAEVTPDEFKLAMSGVKVNYPVYKRTAEIIATGLSVEDVSLLIEKGGCFKVESQSIVAPKVTIKFAVSKIKEESDDV